MYKRPRTTPLISCACEEEKGEVKRARLLATGKARSSLVTVQTSCSWLFIMHRHDTATIQHLVNSRRQSASTTCLTISWQSAYAWRSKDTCRLHFDSVVS